MKKLLLIATALVAAVCASAQTTTPAPITEAPEGTFYKGVYSESDKSYFLYNGSMPASSLNSGYPTDIIVNGSDVYVYNIISHYKTGSWIHGTMDAAGNVEFVFPQTAKFIEATDNNEAHYLYYNMMERLSGSSTYTIAADNVLRFKYSDGTFQQVMPDTDTNLQVSICGDDGVYMAYGERGIYYANVDFEPCTLPEGAIATRYNVSFEDKWDDAKSILVNIAMNDTEIFVGGLCEAMPETWIKGTVDPATGVITIPSGQYVDLYTDSFGSNYVYLLAADYQSPNYVIADAVTLTPTETGYVADKMIIFNYGFRRITNGTIQTIVNKAVVTPYVAELKTPSDPYGFDPDQFTEEDGFGMIFFMLDPIDVDGNALDVDNLYYNIYIEDKLLTITPEEYFVDEAMTDIPYTFQSDFVMGVEGMFIVSFFEPIKKFGVQAVYKVGDEKAYSNLVEYEFEDEGGVADSLIELAPVVDSRYISLDGKTVSQPAPGLYIRRDTRADGSISTSKVVIR